LVSPSGRIFEVDWAAPPLRFVVGAARMPDAVAVSGEVLVHAAGEGSSALT